MGKIYKSVTELIGNTPLLEAGNFAAKIGFNGKFFVSIGNFGCPRKIFGFKREFRLSTANFIKKYCVLSKKMETRRFFYVKLS